MSLSALTLPATGPCTLSNCCVWTWGRCCWHHRVILAPGWGRVGSLSGFGPCFPSPTQFQRSDGAGTDRWMWIASPNAILRAPSSRFNSQMDPQGAVSQGHGDKWVGVPKATSQPDCLHQEPMLRQHTWQSNPHSIFLSRRLAGGEPTSPPL